jgi:hypothetical protein
MTVKVFIHHVPLRRLHRYLLKVYKGTIDELNVPLAALSLLFHQALLFDEELLLVLLHHLYFKRLFV